MLRTLCSRPGNAPPSSAVLAAATCRAWLSWGDCCKRIGMACITSKLGHYGRNVGKAQVVLELTAGISVRFADTAEQFSRLVAGNHLQTASKPGARGFHDASTSIQSSKALASVRHRPPADDSSGASTSDRGLLLR